MPSDRGLSMTSKTVAHLMANLGITKSHSRPYTSMDNPFSESKFRTMKYRPEFPDRFGCVQDARAFGQTFFHSYNFDHGHGGIGHLTPAGVDHGLAETITTIRAAVLAQACAPSVSSEENPGPLPYRRRCGSTRRKRAATQRKIYRKCEPAVPRCR